MKEEKSFFQTVCALAIPVALQSMLQSSFSIVDQIMIGQLGAVSVAGVGLAGKFSGIYSVLVSSVSAVAGIMIAQYLGQKRIQEVRRSFFLNLFLAVFLAAGFAGMCLCWPDKIMGMYTTDPETRTASVSYLKIISGTYLPVAVATMMAALLRCMEKAKLPLYAGIASALMNTGLNYVLIFGKLGFEPMGAEGAAIATLVAQITNMIIMIVLLLGDREVLAFRGAGRSAASRINWGQYLEMLLPILVCELLWSLGENVYAAIYGHLGTESMAAMTLINPVQGLMIGALCGISQAAGVIIGKLLGKKEYDDAYRESWKLICYGFAGSLMLSLLVVFCSGWYVQLYQVEDTVRDLTRQILLAYAIVAPFKVQNMILGGGIIRSGGKTKYVMIIDIVGTWCFGVPLGFLSAFVLKMSTPWVYFILSLEECIRFVISLAVLRRRNWMQSLEVTAHS